MVNEGYIRWLQFFNTIFYMVCIVVLIVIGTYFFLRNNAKTKISNVVVIYMLGSLFYMTRMFEEVMLFEGAAYYYRCIQEIIMVLIMIFSLSIIYYNQHKKRYLIVSFVGLLSLITFIATNSLHHQYLRIYAYHNIVFGQLFRYVLVIALFVHVYVIVKRIKAAKRSQSLTSKFVVMHLLVSLVSISYFLWIIQVLPNKLEVHGYLVFLALLVFSIIGIKYLPTLILPNYFGDIVENILETIIVSDETGNVLYINNTNISCYFENIENIMPNNITHIFKENIEAKVISSMKDQMDIEIYDGQNKFLINCMIRPLIGNKKIDGYVYILSNFTYLRKMIDDLSDKNKELVAINEELADYSQVVSRLEIELENDRIISEVKEYLGQSYLNLFEVLQESVDALESDSPKTLGLVDQAIELARDNLSKVRSVVVKYKREDYDR